MSSIGHVRMDGQPSLKRSIRYPGGCVLFDFPAHLLVKIRVIPSGRLLLLLSCLPANPLIDTLMAKLDTN